MDAWLVLLGAVIAGAVSIGGELLRGRQDTNLDGARRVNDRQIDRDRIQRDTLLAVQTAMGDWLRVQSHVKHFAIQSFRTTGELGTVPNEVDEAASTTGQQLAYLIERVKDASLRSSLAGLMALAIPYVPADEAEVRAAWDALVERVMPVNDQLGDALRQYL